MECDKFHLHNISGPMFQQQAETPGLHVKNVNCYPMLAYLVTDTLYRDFVNGGASLSRYQALRANGQRLSSTVL